jgi:hypothetical protein
MSFFLERKILLSPQDACLIDGDNWWPITA